MRAFFFSLPFVFFLLSAGSAADAGPADARVAFSPGGGSAALVRAALARATSRVDVAMFYFSSESLAQALCDAASRGVSVRVVLDSSMHGAAHLPFIERLSQSGIQVRITRLPPGAKMHLRAAVIDDSYLTTGAANWSDAADRSNVEDALCVYAPSVVPLYRKRIEELFSAGTEPVGTRGRKPAKTPSRAQPLPWTADAVSVNDIRVWLNPDPAALGQLINDLHHAKRIDVGMYLLTNDLLIEALARAATQAQVRLIVDAEMIGGAGLYDLQTLREAGVRVVVFRKERGIMHLKAAVIDSHIVWSGSANWTKNAMQRNAEDMVRLSSGELAGHYTAALDRLDAGGRALESERLVGAPTGSGVNTNGLPPSRPRPNFDNVRRAPATSLVYRARVRYVPDGDYQECLLRMIRAARQTVGILMYVMPEHEGAAPLQRAICDALVQAAQRGLYVYLALYTPPTEGDRLSVHHGNWAERLRAEGVDVRLATPGAPLHAKLVAVDQTHILIGSHNWSEGALSGEKILESSALISLPSPDPRIADYLFGRNVVADMRSRQAWESELAVLRQLSGADGKKRAAILKRAGYEPEDAP